jgi:hypothetical protein
MSNKIIQFAKARRARRRTGAPEKKGTITLDPALDPHFEK